MTSWKTYRLGDIVATNKKSIGRSYPFSMIKYLDTGSITRNHIESLQEYKLSEAPSRAKRLVQEGDIIYSAVRPNQLHYGYISKFPENLVVSTGFIVISCNKDYIEPKFLYYLLTQQEMTDYLHSIADASTSAYPSLKSSDIENLEISLPSLAEQRRIAGILGAIDDKIENNRRINTNLELQAQALYKQWFVDNRSDDWEEKPLSEIINIYDSQRKPLSGQQREKMDKVYPYYGAASLMDYVDDYLFDGIYLLLGEDGTVVDESGFPILQYVWGKFWVNNHAHILTGKNGFSTETLYVLLKQTSVKSIVTGAVQPKISQANLKNILVTIPPKQQLSKYNEVIEPLFRTIRKNNDESSRLATLRDTLLSKLMNGEIKM